jgi:hypothetical protein
MGPPMYNTALHGSFTLGDSFIFLMANGSGSPNIINIYCEKVLTFFKYCFSRQGVK